MGKKANNLKATPVKDTALVKEIMTRGVTDVIPADLFEKKLRTGERMRIYLGVDPTGPDIHLGHAVILRKLAQLQELGHEIILLIGDFTARIGDPTDRSAARVTMKPEEIAANAKTYKQQAGKILDFSAKSKNPARMEFNSKWLEKMTFHDVLELASLFTVQQMLERDMFQERIKADKPIHLHEFLYPVMQGYDSVAMDVDMEVGGNDQLFNMLAGRTLQKSLNDREKTVMTFELLEGTDGRKMSKSYENVVGVMDEPVEMFGKVMSLSDELIPKYFWLCTDYTKADLNGVERSLQRGDNPRDMKICLARQIVMLYHSEKAANEAEKEFLQVFQKKEKPTEMPTHKVSAKDKTLVDLMVSAGVAKSKSEARRLIEQGGVRLNDKKITDRDAVPSYRDGDVLQVGKRKFVRLRA
ncbi:tyrosine--tRNA ligase [Patescibacteria group bacterium]